MAATTEQLIALLGYDPNAHYAQLQAQGVPQFAIDAVRAENNAKINSAYPPAVTANGTVAPTAPVSAAAPPPGQAPVLNVPYGSDYLDPTLALYAQMLGLASNEKTFGLGLAEDQRQFNLQFPESQRQFNQTLGLNQQQFGVNTLMDAAKYLANLYAQGPMSAAELAFYQSGLGFPAIGGSSAAAQDLIGAATRGATGNTTFSAGGQAVNIPNTLSGAQLRGLQGNPNAAGVIQSFAKAAGNPDIYQRSFNALIPSGYTGTGGGLG